LEILKELKKV